MEFWMKKGRAEYMGLNVFITDGHGHFLRNVEASEQEKWSSLSSVLSCREVLSEVRDWYLCHLPRLAPWYEGPVGVDMLITSDGNLNPCVEINWRMTMGMAGVLAGKVERGMV